MIYLTDAQLEELTACSTSACYLLSHYGYLRHPSRGRIAWDLYDWQTDILERLEAGEDIVVIKSRQVGMSWTLAAYGLWVAMLHPNKDVMFVSRTERSAIFLLDKVKYLISNMPEWLTGEMISETKTLIKFGFRDDDPSSETYGQILGTSVITSSTTTSHAGRGESYAFVLGDEVAFWPDKESEVMWESMKPTLSHSGQGALVSTPNGLKGALFDRLYFEALYNQNSFSALKVHWKDCGFDDEWYAKATEGMTKKQILQEYECDFIGSGNPVFDLASVKNCYKPKFSKEKTRLSFTGIDTAEGRGRQGDCHSAVVLNEQGVQIFAENSQDTLSAWAGSIQSRNGIDSVIPGRVSRIHSDFPGPMIIEANGTGMTVYKMHKLPELPNCRLIPRKMTSKSKPAIMTQLAVALESGEVTITDSETFNQLLAYSYDNSGSMNAPSGRHDDLVVALAWAYESLKSYGIVIVSELDDSHHNDADYQMAAPKRQYESVPDRAREGYYTELNPTFFGVEDPSEKFRSRIW